MSHSQLLLWLWIQEKRAWCPCGNSGINTMEGRIRDYDFPGCGGGQFKPLGLLDHLERYGKGCEYHRIARDLLIELYRNVGTLQQNKPNK